MISKDSPIGIFDSGLGGMSVALEVAKHMSTEKVIYVGDSGHFPYGPKSLEEVRKYGLQICNWLYSQGAKLIIIACGTSTTATLDLAQKQIPIPVIGVVRAGARTALSNTANKKIGVLATEATVKSDIYKKTISTFDPTVKVYQQAAPKLVEMAENGLDELSNKYIDSHDPKLISDYFSSAYSEENISIAKNYCVPLLEKGVDTVIAGCTHFALLEAMLNVLLGKEAALVSSSLEAVHEAYFILEKQNLMADNARNYAEALDNYYFYTTGDNVQKYQDFGSLIFNHELKHIEKLSL